MNRRSRVVILVACAAAVMATHSRNLTLRRIRAVTTGAPEGLTVNAIVPPTESPLPGIPAGGDSLASSLIPARFNGRR